jgi:WbqC-like protein family
VMNTSLHKVVISQSMYFPWVGFLEQLRQADIFVRYDDVQFSKGSFTNRVQIKAPAASQWMTVPLNKHKLGQSIDEVQIDDTKDWRTTHIEQLRVAYARAPFFKDMLAIVEAVFSKQFKSIGELAFWSQMSLMDYFSLNLGLRVLNIKDLKIPGSGSQRVHDAVSLLGGCQYITGHGALNYLDHQAMERSGIEVRYMRYQKQAYPQMHGEFTPFVSALDLVAHCGKQGAQFIQSTTCSWREFHHESNR